MADWWDHVVAASSPADGNNGDIILTNAPSTIDGVSSLTMNGKRVLLKHQITKSQNTTYTYTAGTPGNPNTLMATNDSPAPSATVRVDQGAVNAKTEWCLVDTTNYVWARQAALNVRDFGALGDGTTHDDSAINAAINALIALGGGQLYFPPGTYAIANQLNYHATGPGPSIRFRWQAKMQQRRSGRRSGGKRPMYLCCGP